MQKDRKISLAVLEPASFSLLWERWKIIFWWQKDTELSNYVWVRMISLGIRWPPVFHIECFMETRE